MARRGAAVLALALGAAGCAQPGTPIPKPQAAKLTAGTGDIATACGYALQATAFPHQHSRLARLESMAHRGAVQLAAVLDHDHDQRDLYQGETVDAIVHESIALLNQCGLRQASGPLRAALTANRR
jgi:hypothetical protein